MEKIPCSVGILTFNSAATLERTLESVRAFDDIVLCDGGSTDETLAIAKRFDARVIAQDPAFQNPDGSLADYAGVRNQCLDAARYDWFFYIDSDEYATPELVEEIRSVVLSGARAPLVYNLSPRVVVDGQVIEHSSNYPGWQKRLFNRTSGARFRKAVHERITYDEAAHPAGSLSGHWHYFISGIPDTSKGARYARMDARMHYTKDTGRFLSLVFRKLMTSLKIFVTAAYHSLRYGKAAMPFALEMTRVRYHLLIVRALWDAYRGAESLS